MPRDASGNFTLVSGNPVTTGTTIESNWANTTMADLRDGLTDSLSRSGAGGMSAPLKNIDGALADPAITFTSDTLTGLMLESQSQPMMVLGGQRGMRWSLDNGDAVCQLWTNGAWANVLTSSNSGDVSETIYINPDDVVKRSKVGASTGVDRHVLTLQADADTTGPRLSLFAYDDDSPSAGKVSITLGATNPTLQCDSEWATSLWAGLYVRGTYAYAVGCSLIALDTPSDVRGYLAGGANYTDSGRVRVTSQYDQLDETVALGVPNDFESLEVKPDGVSYVKTFGDVQRRIGWAPSYIVSTSSRSLADSDIGNTINIANTLTLTLGTRVTAQEGSLIMIVVQDNATLTLTEGGGITLVWLQGGAQQVGTRTVAGASVVTLQVRTGLIYNLWGSGIS